MTLITATSRLSTHRQWALALFAVFFIGCATSKPRFLEKDPTEAWMSETVLPSGTASEEYRQIRTFYQRGNNAEAFKRLKVFEKRYKESQKVPQALNLAGLVYLKQGHPLQAIQRFKKAETANRNPESIPYLKYNIATAQYEAKQYGESEATLASFPPENLDLQTALKYYYILGLLAARRNDSTLALQHYYKGSLLLPNLQKGSPVYQEIRSTYEKQILHELESQHDDKVLEGLHMEFAHSPLLDHVLYYGAKSAIQASEVGRADQWVRELSENFPDSVHQAEVLDLMRSVQNYSVVNTRAIGILLPMTGKFASFGRRCLHAIEYGFRIYQPEQPDSHVSLVIEDAGNTAEEAVAALERLYFTHHVIAVIGPLLRGGLEAVTTRAQGLGVPLLSLAESGPIKSDYVFSVGINYEHQVRSIVQWANRNSPNKRFAIMYPQTKEGREYSTRFWDEIESLGGEISAIESYPPNETDFRFQVERMVGRFYTDARYRELEQLEKLREQDKITKKNRKTQKYFDLPPIVDFDAVFIPDEARIVGQIIPTFDYSDVDNVYFLGTTKWNSPTLIQRAGALVEQKAVFVDSFYAKNPKPQVQQFVQGFYHTFGYEPATYEAIAYDAATILERVLLLGGSSGLGRRDVRKYLTEMTAFLGTTGKIWYENGGLQRDLGILTIQNGQIVEQTH